MNYTARQLKLVSQLHKVGVDALLITHLPNIRYLCGFTGTAGVLLVSAHSSKPKLTFYTDGRYSRQAADQVQGAKVVIRRKSAFAEALDALKRAKFKSLGFESEHLFYSDYRILSNATRGKLRLKPTSGVVEDLRIIKDADEIERIKAAVLAGSGLFPNALEAIKVGVAENEIAGELEFQARRAGAEGMSFDTIVAAGLRSALPHGRASDQPIPADGFIILDYGVILAGYCSDMTRTIHVGRASRERRRMYDAIREAQLASIEAVRPGREAGEVDEAGRTLLKKAGYGEYFTHSTGHGVGIEVHEQPRLAKGQTRKLLPGMVITIEPGIYIPEEGGVRIEDMVLVTESGHEVLTPTTKDLIEV
jgi:Xaa-Pro aminopeptidase